MDARPVDGRKEYTFRMALTRSENVKDIYQKTRGVGMSNYEVRQMLIPDTQGRWPGDPLCDEPYASQARNWLQ